jgi:endonuclease/exonuclease/phosphatase family metal-dependent hydrolase
MATAPAGGPTTQSADVLAGCGTWRLGNLHGRSAWGIAGLALALCILGPSCLADTIRVTTWNLEPLPAAGTNDARIQDAAAALMKLNPDVILLQQVRDWKMCGQLAQALKPVDYSVSVCSSFREAKTGALGQQQVAILARKKAYFSWSEAWRTQSESVLPGGLAFAAIQIGKQRVGFFSVQAGSAAVDARVAEQRAAMLQARAASIGQLLEEVSSVRNWVANQVQVFVVAGTLDAGAQATPVRLLEQAGFGDVFLEAPVVERITVAGKTGHSDGTADYIFTQPAGCATNPRILSTAVSGHYPVTCELELDQAKVIAAQAARVEALPVPEPGRSKPEPLPTVAASPTSLPAGRAQASNRPLVTTAALAGMAVLAAMAWLLLRRRRALPRPTPALLAAGQGDGGFAPSSYTVVMGTRSATEPAPADAHASSVPRSIIQIETPGATQTQAEVLRQRALAAEQRAEEATAVIRSGLIPYLSHWLKQKLVRKLIADRAQLLETQQVATLKVAAVEERLARIEQQVQRQNSAYQERIEALTRELILAKEESRELIRARITQVKAEMEAARARLMAQTESDDDGGA